VFPVDELLKDSGFQRMKGILQQERDGVIQLPERRENSVAELLAICSLLVELLQSPMGDRVSDRLEERHWIGGFLNGIWDCKDRLVRSSGGADSCLIVCPAAGVPSGRGKVITRSSDWQ
jgi:hypothetical protein